MDSGPAPAYSAAMPVTVLRFGALLLAQAQRLADRIEGCASAVAISEIDEKAPLWEVAAYCTGSEQAAQLQQRLASETADGRVEILPEADWVEQSLKGLHPVVAGRYFLHGSHDRRRRRSGGISLEVEAGTAFGTGHHATTAGCLLALDALLKRQAPRRILDVGCGTGILALAAARSLRRPVVAGDIDAEAVRVTRLNARRNAAGPLVCAVTASGLDHRCLRDAAVFDLIFANILARPLIGLAGALSRALAPGGHLVLSGLTADQARWVGAAYRNRGLAWLARSAIGPWSVLVFTKAKRPP